jgi:hypothetical protein
MLALTTGLAALSLGDDGGSEGMNLYLGLLEQGGVEALALAHTYEERGGEWTAEEMAEARHLVTLVSERVPTSKTKTMEAQQQLYDAFQVILESNRAGDDFFMALLENYDPDIAFKRRTSQQIIDYLAQRGITFVLEPPSTQLAEEMHRALETDNFFTLLAYRHQAGLEWSPSQTERAREQLRLPGATREDLYNVMSDHLEFGRGSSQFYERALREYKKGVVWSEEEREAILTALEVEAETEDWTLAVKMENALERDDLFEELVDLYEEGRKWPRSLEEMALRLLGLSKRVTPEEESEALRKRDAALFHLVDLVLNDRHTPDRHLYKKALRHYEAERRLRRREKRQLVDSLQEVGWGHVTEGTPDRELAQRIQKIVVRGGPMQALLQEMYTTYKKYGGAEMWTDYQRGEVWAYFTIVEEAGLTEEERLVEEGVELLEELFDKAGRHAITEPSLHFLAHDEEGTTLRVKRRKAHHSIMEVALGTKKGGRFAYAPLGELVLGRFVCRSPEKCHLVTDLLRRLVEDFDANLAETVQVTAHCPFCWNPIKNKASMEAGCGEICAKKYRVKWRRRTGEKVFIPSLPGAPELPQEVEVEMVAESEPESVKESLEESLSETEETPEEPTDLFTKKRRLIVVPPVPVDLDQRTALFYRFQRLTIAEQERLAQLLGIVGALDLDFATMDYLQFKQMERYIERMETERNPGVARGERPTTDQIGMFPSLVKRPLYSQARANESTPQGPGAYQRGLVRRG